MAKPPVIEPHENRHVLKVAAVTGQNTFRDVALLTVFYGTGLTPNEVAKLRVSDYLIENRQIRIDSMLGPEITFHGKARPLFWANVKTCAAIDSYLAYRLSVHHGITTRRAAHRGLDPSSPLFLTGEGEPFAFTKRVTSTGAVSYSCETLTEILVAFIQAHPDLKAIGTQHGGVTGFVPQALQQAGKKPGQIIVGGIDLAPATIAGLRSKFLTATLDQQLYLQGFLPVTQCGLSAAYQFARLTINTGAGVQTPATIDSLIPLIKRGIR